VKTCLIIRICRAQWDVFVYSEVAKVNVRHTGGDVNRPIRSKRNTNKRCGDTEVAELTLGKLIGYARIKQENTQVAEIQEISKCAGCRIIIHQISHAIWVAGYVVSWITRVW